jgi:hypothetical protein
MVGQHLHRVAEGILRDAQKQVHVKTGKLQRSLHIEHIQGASGQSVRVGSDLKYAYLHHEGTKPHIITPNPPNKTLRFGSGSRVVYTNMVRHPGTKANRYLTDQLRTHVR